MYMKILSWSFVIDFDVFCFTVSDPVKHFRFSKNTVDRSKVNHPTDSSLCEEVGREDYMTVVLQMI